MNGTMCRELETSVANGDVETVRRILAEGGELDYLNSYGMTLLGMAASAGQKEVVLLLLALGADPDEDDYEGETAVTYALYGKHYETLFCLLESKDEAVGARRRVDLLRWAAAYGDVYCMERLLNDGVFVDALDEEGSTALIYAASNSKYEAV